jgi:hypothetical protein
MAGEDLTLLGALLRKYAIELRALARHTSPRVAGRLHQGFRSKMIRKP